MATKDKVDFSQQRYKVAGVRRAENERARESRGFGAPPPPSPAQRQPLGTHGRRPLCSEVQNVWPRSLTAKVHSS